MGEWTVFSNHGHVLVCLANNNQARLRDVAAEVGITERAVQNILRELQDSGLVQVSKHGRCNHYQINLRKSLRHPLEAHCTVGKLLQVLRSEDAARNGPETVEPVKPARKPAHKSTAPAKAEAPAAAPAKTEQPKSQSPKGAASSKADSKPKELKTESKSEKSESDKPKTPDTQQGSLF